MNTAAYLRMVVSNIPYSPIVDSRVYELECQTLGQKIGAGQRRYIERRIAEFTDRARHPRYAVTQPWAQDWHRQELDALDARRSRWLNITAVRQTSAGPSTCWRREND